MKLKIACIGAGYFAPYHIEAWKRIPEVEVVAICDQEEEKAKKLAAEFRVGQVYSSVETLCRDSDFEIADIITPPETHPPLVQYFAEAGKHIICQKPLAPSLELAREMVRVTREAGVRFAVHENFRFQPWHRKIKELLEKGVLGDQLHTLYLRMRTGDGWGADAYLGRQPYFRSMPRLLMYETGIHYIDVFRFMAGEMNSVYARLRQLNPVIAGEDCGLVIFDFEKGGQGVLDANRYNESNAADPRYTFGAVRVEGKEGTIRLYEDGRLTLQPLGRGEQAIDYPHESRGFAGDCVYFAQRHFAEAFLFDRPFETAGEAYLKNLIILEATYQSHEKRKEIRLDQ